MELGCGLFGLASELEQDSEQTLKQLAESGFTAVEPIYAFRNDPALAPDSPVPSFVRTLLWDEQKVRMMLPKLNEWGLAISSMHIGLSADIKEDDALPELISFSKKTGIRFFMTSLEFDTLEKCRAAARQLDYANQILNPHGIHLGYHNHYMEFKKVIADGRECTLMEDFLEHTSDKVMLQLDVGWQLFGGDDVISFMEKYSSRIFSVHLKDFVADFASVDEKDSFAAVGDGVLPTEKILNQIPNLPLIPHGLMIDQDRAAKGQVLLSDLKKGSDYLRTIILALNQADRNLIGLDN
ncbi:MAG: sugar phosphate isomerase/epimerase [Lachnospiraceae bacterium]|nr:sugar phosphate isomerase/epimerase [Lachnospiraceae bacterium]